jgi:hypothetical protein
VDFSYQMRPTEKVLDAVDLVIEVIILSRGYHHTTGSDGGAVSFSDGFQSKIIVGIFIQNFHLGFSDKKHRAQV